MGILAANKIVDGRSQGVFGFDAYHYFTETLRIAGQLAMSSGKGDHTAILPFFSVQVMTRAFFMFTWDIPIWANALATT